MGDARLDASEAAKNALKLVLEAITNERLLVVCDEQKRRIGEAFASFRCLDAVSCSEKAERA